MIKRTVDETRLADLSSIKKDLASWLTSAPEERVAAVDDLRRQHHCQALWTNSAVDLPDRQIIPSPIVTNRLL